MNATEALLIREDHGPVVRLVLNSPANFNALSLAMIDALTRAFQQLAQEDHVRAVIIAATGKAFSAGHDLREMQAARADADQGRGAYAHLFAACSQMMQMIPALPQPVIAEVQGIATAAGCQLVASCDLALAAEGVKFGVNGVNLGLFCSTPMVALTRAISPRTAFELLVTGDFIGSDRAAELGLINRAVPADQLQDQAMALAQKIASKLPEAVRLGKRAFRDQAHLPLDQAYALTSERIVQNMMFSDTAEGIQAFLEKNSRPSGSDQPSIARKGKVSSSQ